MALRLSGYGAHACAQVWYGFHNVIRAKEATICQPIFRRAGGVTLLDRRQRDGKFQPDRHPAPYR